MKENILVLINSKVHKYIYLTYELCYIKIKILILQKLKS